jgi:hypothetical protein
MASLAPVTWAHISIDAPQTFLKLPPQHTAAGEGQDHATGSGSPANPLLMDPGSPSYLGHTTSTLSAIKTTTPGFLKNGLHPEGPAAVMLREAAEQSRAHQSPHSHMLGQYLPLHSANPGLPHWMLPGGHEGGAPFQGPPAHQVAPQVGTLALWQPCIRSDQVHPVPVS